MPAVVGRTAGGASQYSGTFAIVVSTGGATLEYSRIACPAVSLIDSVIAANPDQVAGYRAGKEALLGFFVGQVIKASKGKANPKVVNERLRAKLRG